MDIETSVFKNGPEVLTSCTVGHIADENLGGLPGDNIVNGPANLKNLSIGKHCNISMASSVHQVTFAFSSANISISTIAI